MFTTLFDIPAARGETVLRGGCVGEGGDEMTCYIPRLTISRGVRRKMHSLPARASHTRASMDLVTAAWACEQVGWEIEDAIVIPVTRDACEIRADDIDALLDGCERMDGRPTSMSGRN